VSWQNDLITRVVLPLQGGKRRASDPERYRRGLVATQLRPTAYGPPRGLQRRVTITVQQSHGWPVYELAPRSAPTAAHRTVIFFHGGSYTKEIQGTHYRALAEFVRATGCHAVVPIYPLAPVSTAEQTVAVAARLTAELAERVGAADLVVMGDSAGGGLALAVAQALRDQGVIAARTVLIAPWLDVATDAPEARALEPDDAMLGIPGLQVSGRLYAGELALDDPRPSPIHGELAGLGPIAVFTGTADLLLSDSRRLRDLGRAAGVEVTLTEAPGMPHDYPLMRTPEGAAARREIAALLR
jgi:monoterpene epsilon-lactone hydrolase